MEIMETYRLKSKLVENDSEYLILTSNDAERQSVSSVITVNGDSADVMRCSHPGEISSEDVLSLVKMKHNEAKREIESLLEVNRRVLRGGDPQQMVQLGLAFLYRRFYLEARELFRAAVALDAQAHQAYHYLAQAEMGRREPAAAINAAEAAVERRPRYADYRNILGEAFLLADSCRRALTEFEQAKEINLYYSDAYFNAGLAIVRNAMTGEDAEAARMWLSRATDNFQRAAVIHPEFRTDAFQSGLEALQRSDREAAMELMSRVRDEKKESHRREFADFYGKMVLLPEWASEEATAERIEFLLGEIKKNPSYVDLHAELGRCYFEQSRASWQKGVERYRRTIEMNPAIPRIDGHLEDADKEYESICAVLSRITERG